MKEIQGVVFDCDGVLFESRRANLAYYNTLLAHFGEPPVAEDDHARAHLCHTAASNHVLAQLLGKERVEEALALAIDVDYRQFIPYMTPEPGLHEALTKLSGSLPLAIATNRGYSMPCILDHFGLRDYFRAVVTCHDVPKPKPAPDMLVEVARRLQAPIDKLLFVGDSELDHAAAKAAGMPFAIYQGNLKADIRLQHHQELVALLLNETDDNHKIAISAR